jgi:hypothetical protein
MSLKNTVEVPGGKYLNTIQMGDISGLASRTMNLYLKTDIIPGGFKIGDNHNARWFISEKDFYQWIEGKRNKTLNRERKAQ